EAELDLVGPLPQQNILGKLSGCILNHVDRAGTEVEIVVLQSHRPAVPQRVFHADPDGAPANTAAALLAGGRRRNAPSDEMLSARVGGAAFDIEQRVLVGNADTSRDGG